MRKSAPNFAPRYTLPWLMILLLFLILVTYVPLISLWLPGLLGMS